ncbi:MAG: cobalamin B12-binding domain-containing protein [Methanopyri archaeon]|nr:cobalamin B12-binding domain-containing protein [Methanopyri archaeon]
MARGKRFLMAKPGLDGHDRGAKVVSMALRDAGMEVIYTGLHQTPEQIVEAAIQEDVDCVGMSILSGAHMTLVPRVLELAKKEGIFDQVLFLAGGTIVLKKDIDALKEMGVANIYGPGTPTKEIVDFIFDFFARGQSRE